MSSDPLKPPLLTLASGSLVYQYKFTSCASTISASPGSSCSVKMPVAGSKLLLPSKALQSSVVPMQSPQTLFAQSRHL